MRWPLALPSPTAPFECSALPLRSCSWSWRRSASSAARSSAEHGVPGPNRLPEHVRFPRMANLRGAGGLRSPDARRKFILGGLLLVLIPILGFVAYGFI